jgi:hypothetical protein
MLDLDGKRGRRKMKQRGGAGETSQSCDGDKRFQMAELDVHYSFFFITAL